MWQEIKGEDRRQCSIGIPIIAATVSHAADSLQDGCCWRNASCRIVSSAVWCMTSLCRQHAGVKSRLRRRRWSEVSSDETVEQFSLSSVSEMDECRWRWDTRLWCALWVYLVIAWNHAKLRNRAHSLVTHSSTRCTPQNPTDTSQCFTLTFANMYLSIYLNLIAFIYSRHEVPVHGYW